MRKFFLASLIALLVGIPFGAAAHEGWFVRICPAKTDANRVHLAFSGARQGFGWSWIKGWTPDEIDLPRRFRSVGRLTMRAPRARHPAIFNLTLMSASGSAIIWFSGWNSTITKIIKRIGMIRMIAPARGWP